MWRCDDGDDDIMIFGDDDDIIGVGGGRDGEMVMGGLAIQVT